MIIVYDTYMANSKRNARNIAFSVTQERIRESRRSIAAHNTNLSKGLSTV